jgi:hypothetical protein
VSDYAPGAIEVLPRLAAVDSHATYPLISSIVPVWNRGGGPNRGETFRVAPSRNGLPNFLRQALARQTDDCRSSRSARVSPVLSSWRFRVASRSITRTRMIHCCREAGIWSSLSSSGSNAVPRPSTCHWPSPASGRRLRDRLRRTSISLARAHTRPPAQFGAGQPTEGVGWELFAIASVTPAKVVITEPCPPVSSVPPTTGSHPRAVAPGSVTRTIRGDCTARHGAITFMLCRTEERPSRCDLIFWDTPRWLLRVFALSGLLILT